jgi:hypothetical protein
MLAFFESLKNLLAHDLKFADTARAQKIVSVIDEVDKVIKVAAQFVPLPQAAAVAAIADEVDAVAHKIVPPTVAAPAPLGPAVPPAAPVPSAPPATVIAPQSGVPTPSLAQKLAADFAIIEQDLLKQ